MAGELDAVGIGPTVPGTMNEVWYSSSADVAQSSIAQDTSVKPDLDHVTGDESNGTSALMEETPLLAEDRASENRKEPGRTLNEVNIDTTWQHEFKVIGLYTLPLIPTFILQYTLLLSSLVSIGHFGTVELGAVSLGAMAGQITGNAVFSGLTTSLDTLCPQAYGSGKKQMVGLLVQRMTYFLWVICLPIGVLWYFSPQLLGLIIPEKEVAILAGQYLCIVWFGLPGYAMFAAGKRFFQAQGNFTASLYIVMFVAPLNAFLNWFFVWQLGWGFYGAPIAVVIANHMLWICQVLYVIFIGGRDCWPGFTTQALGNWWPMVRLAVPGLIMVEAEVIAFEILMLASAYFGTAKLAANTVLTTAINLAFMIPFPLSTATSTRIAHLIGARSPDAAKVSAYTGVIMAIGIGVFNVILLSTLKDYVPRVFSSDPKVWHEAAKVLPLCAVVLLFDSTAACCNGILRGLGRQSIGAYVQLFCYYIIGTPISFGTAFGAHWELFGLWGGILCALVSVTIIEALFLRNANWQSSVDDLQRREEDI